MLRHCVGSDNPKPFSFGSSSSAEDKRADTRRAKPKGFFYFRTMTALVAIEVGLNGLPPTYNTGFRTPRSTPRRLSARYYTSSEASGETNSVTINRCLMGQLVWSGILGQMGWVDTLVETCGRSKGWAITLGRPMLFFLVYCNRLFWVK